MTAEQIAVLLLCIAGLAALIAWFRK